MPSLAQSLEGRDLGHLRMVAELWGIDLRAKDAQDGIQKISGEILNKELVGEIVEALHTEAQRALAELRRQRRIPWGQFSRSYGEVREMGRARREKEQPHHNPKTISEQLWYRALVARAFFDSPQGPREYAYIPDDFLDLLSPQVAPDQEAFGRPARPAERSHVDPCSDGILNEACSLLAARRLGLKEEELAAIEEWEIPAEALSTLLMAAGVLDDKGNPVPEATRAFLEAERGDALRTLAQAWLESEEFDELRLLPGLRAEGKWVNRPRRARGAVLGFLERTPHDGWWSLPALITDVKARAPDFQREAGDYDSWYLRDEESGEYLRGFDYWDRVDGALIAYIVRGPMHWLGMIDLAGPQKGEPAVAFRRSKWADELLQGQPPKGLNQEKDELVIDSQGQILASRAVPRAVRYQVARFCAWETPKRGAYAYRIRAGSLARARAQGLEVRQLIALLKAHCSTPLPPNLLQALERWSKQGTQAKVGDMLVLRVGTTAMLKALRASRAARYLGEPLGPNAIEVKAGARSHVLQVLTEMGYLGEIEEDEIGD